MFKKMQDKYIHLLEQYVEKGYTKSQILTKACSMFGLPKDLVFKVFEIFMKAKDDE